MKSLYAPHTSIVKGLLSVVLALCMMTALLLPAFAELDEPVQLDTCDLTWNGTTLDSKEKTEGKASISWTIPANGSFHITKTWSKPVDATGANRLEFDMYVSNADAYYSMTGGNSLELTSSGTCDVEETAWTLTDLELEDGWNRVSLIVSENGGCDLSRINYMRLYSLGHNNDAPYTIKLDNIQLTYVDPADVEVVDTSNMILGTETAETAVPKPVTNVDTDAPAVDPEQTTDKTPEDEPKPATEPVIGTTVAIVALCVAGALLIVLLILVATKHANRVVVAVLAVVMVVALVLGIVGFVGGDEEGKEPSDGPDATEPDDENDPADAEDVELTPDAIKAGLVDQTGHPENSAASVDVEALLKVDPDYNTKEDYTVHYTGVKTLTDYSALPHVDMTEVPTESGISFQALTPDEVEKMVIVDRNCWLFVHLRNNDTNKFRLSLDDAAAEQFKGKTLRLTFITYVNSETTFTVEYTDANGADKTATSAGNKNRNVWTEFHVDIENPSFDGSKDGYDFFVTCKGPELIRISAIFASEGVSGENAPQTGLIETTYETSYNIIAEENVKTYGAVGDGYSNDTSAFKEAIDACAAKGGGTVFVPAGYYCLTESLSLPTGVALVGELEMGTANGTVLCIYHGKGSADAGKSAIFLNHQASVQNIAFWYPEQTFVNGTVIPYPPTITQSGSEGVTVRNVTFVNAYFGINYATYREGSSNSLQYTRDIYGTCLDIGYYNTPSYDIGKLEQFYFSPDYWLESGLPGTPNAELLRTYMLRNSTGVILERIDWTYIADINVDGYHIGIQTSMDPNGLGTPNGHMYNINLKDCYYCLYAEEMSWMVMSKCNFTATGNDGAAAIYISPLCAGDITIVEGNLESDGANAIINYGQSKITLTSCNVKSAGTAYANLTGEKAAFTNSTITGGDNYDYGILTSDHVLALPDVDYGKTVELKPKSDKFINLTEAPYNAPKNGADITEILQKALDDLKETGGTVYLPAGTYTLSGHIDVWAGIELRGAAIWAHSFSTPTQINTAFGHNDPDGEALFDLYEGSGMIGISVVYNQQNTNDLQEYSFTVRGRGSDIYMMAVTLPTSWNGVDFASERCDNHYIEYIHGCFLNQGIVVGAGSENGIIRDCHLTPNCFCVHSDANWWTGPYVSIMTRGTPFVIGESKNQILYHNFTYGAYKGLVVTDGAQDVYVLSHGVDSGDISAYFSGDCTVTMVNAELVNLHTKGNAKHFNYVYTDEDFIGTLNIINMAGWGTSRNAFNLNGLGVVNITGGQIHAAGAPMIELNAGDVSVVGLINSSRTTDFMAGDIAISIHVTGNIFATGLRFDPSVDENLDELTGADLEVYGK